MLLYVISPTAKIAFHNSLLDATLLKITNHLIFPCCHGGFYCIIFVMKELKQ